MTPTELKAYLDRILHQRLKISIMIWGAPGIGKSSAASQLEIRVVSF